MRVMTIAVLSIFLVDCSAAYRILHCHKPTVGDVRLVSNIPTVVVVEANVRNAKESWFECWRKGGRERLKSNIERREGSVIGEFRGLPPNTEYSFAVLAKNACGETSVLASRDFRTPPAWR